MNGQDDNSNNKINNDDDNNNNNTTNNFNTIDNNTKIRRAPNLLEIKCLRCTCPQK